MAAEEVEESATGQEMNNKENRRNQEARAKTVCQRHSIRTPTALKKDSPDKAGEAIDYVQGAIMVQVRP